LAKMSAILRFAKASPFAFGVAYSGLKTSACDLLVQKVVERREEIDWRRNAAFATFGFFYLGGVQYALYVPIFSRLFPNAATFASKTVAEKLKDFPGIRNLFAQVFIDQGVHHPLMYFPVFYMIKDAVTSDKPNPERAVNEYIGNMQEDLFALWKVWVPSTFLNFAFMPMWLRIPWVASTSAIWTCILSVMRGGSDSVPANEVISPIGPDHASMELVQRTVAPAPTLDPTREHYLVTVHGPDRPGIVAAVTRGVYDAGGNLTTGKMIKLGGEFAVMMHVDCDPSSVGQLQEKLHHEKHQGGPLAACDINTRRVALLDSASVAPAFEAHVRLTGPDQPGLVMKLTELLASHGLNLEHVQTEQHVQPKNKSQTRLFSLNGLVTSATEPDSKAINESLEQIRRELKVTCILERIVADRG